MFLAMMCCQILRNQEVAINDLLCDAITQKKCVSLHYNGHHRIVEVHAVGYGARTVNILLRCYQIFGGSESNEPEGWKLMHVNKISNCFITAKNSQAPRPEYKSNDQRMAGGIICQV